MGEVHGRGQIWSISEDSLVPSHISKLNVEIRIYFWISNQGKFIQNIFFVKSPLFESFELSGEKNQNVFSQSDFNDWNPIHYLYITELPLFVVITYSYVAMICDEIWYFILINDIVSLHKVSF